MLAALPPYFLQAVISPDTPGRARRRARGAGHRQRRLSDPGDAARRAGAPDRRHPGADRPARDRGRSAAGRRRTGRRHRRARGRRQLDAVGQPLPADAGGAARGRRDADRGLQVARAGARPADPDRPRDRLVRARDRGDGHRPQPDLGDARGADHRRLDGVQRHPDRALPPGARRRALDRRGAASDLRAHRRRRPRLRA